MPALEAGRLEIRCDLTGGDEFLDGFDLRDPEFENWLRLERMRQDGQRPGGEGFAEAPAPKLTPAPAGLPNDYRRPDRLPVVLLSRGRTARDRLSLLEDLFADCLSLSLRDVLGLSIYGRAQRPMPPGALDIRMTAFDAGLRRRGLRVEVQEVESGRALWSGHHVSEAAGTVLAEDLGLIRFANLVIEAIGDALSLPQDPGDRTNPLMLQRLAVRKMWTMQPRRMMEADALLSTMADLAPGAIIFARQAQLRALQIIERVIPDPEAAHLQAIDLCHKALEHDPNNSVVLALVAYVRWMTDADPLTSILLARRSVEMNPCNPIAWDSLGLAKLRQGKVEEARLASDYLARREADFSLDRMVRDDDYPVVTLRRFGIIDKDLANRLG